MKPDYIKVLEFQFECLWEDFLTIEKRKETIKNKMLTTYESLRQSDPNLPYPVQDPVDADWRL